MSNTQENKAFKRKVFFIGGMIPHGTRYYTPILMKGMARHGKLYDRKIDFEMPEGERAIPEFTMQSSCTGEQDTQTHFKSLDWGDLQRKWKKENFFFAMMKGYFALFKLIFLGDLFRIYRYYWGFGNGIVILALIPLLLLFGSFALVSYGLDFLALPPVLHWVATYILACLLITVVTMGKDRTGLRMAVHLIRIRYDYAAGRRRDLETRLDEFAREVKDAMLNEDCDEMLIVGHSFGALLAVDVLSRILPYIHKDDIKANHIGLLNLGSIHHYVGVIPGAHQFRQALKIVGESDLLYWFEPYIPQDGINFPGRNAVEDFAGISPVSGPHKKSVRYRELVREETYKETKYKFWWMHFQYLREGDYQGDYSFYRMICSDKPLRDNYGLREAPKEGYMRPDPGAGNE